MILYYNKQNFISFLCLHATMSETMVTALRVNKELWKNIRRRAIDKEMNLTAILDESLKDWLKKK